jgi:hypothetical protein
MKKLSHFICLSILLVTGTSFKCYSQWTKCQGLENQWISSLASSGNNLLAGVWGGFLYHSLDSGATWTPLDTIANIWVCPDCNIVLTPSIILFARGSDVFAGAGNDVDTNIYVSTDNGLSWTAKDIGFSKSVTCFASIGQTVFAGTYAANDRGVFHSTDLGTSWIATDSIGTVSSLTGLGTTLFASTEGKGIYRSTNDGTSWDKVDTNSLVFFNGLVTLGTDIFASAFQLYNTPPSTGGVYVSTDNGDTWNHSDTGLTDRSINVLYTDGSTLFVGTLANIFASTDTGKTWRNISPEPDSLGCWALSVYGSRLLAGTQNGIWQYPLSQIFTGIENPSLQLPERFVLEQNYPNPFNPTTVINYEMPRNDFVTIGIYDMLGRPIETLLSQIEPAGSHSVMFNADNMSSGVYFYRLIAGGVSLTKRMMLIK